MDRAAVAERIGVDPDTITRYLNYSRPGGRYAGHPFPAPSGHLGRSPYWAPDRMYHIRR